MYSDSIKGNNSRGGTEPCRGARSAPAISGPMPQAHPQSDSKRCFGSTSTSPEAAWMNAFESQTVVGVFFARHRTRGTPNTRRSPCCPAPGFSRTARAYSTPPGREGRTACMTTSLWPHGFPSRRPSRPRPPGSGASPALDCLIGLDGVSPLLDITSATAPLRTSPAHGAPKSSPLNPSMYFVRAKVLVSPLLLVIMASSSWIIA